MAQAGVTRLIVTSPPNVTWLTGSEASAACAVIEPERVVLITDRRYAEAAAALATDGVLDLVIVERTYDETLASLVTASPLPAGIEAGHFTVQRQRWLAAALAAAGWRHGPLVPTVDVIEAGRLVKDAWEIERLREAGRRISAVALGVLADLAPGQREQDVAQALEAGLRRAGFTRPAFDTIVASGPRSALPTGVPRTARWRPATLWCWTLAASTADTAST